jgi:tetratricopeptide (TPR) repeat protein
VSKLFFTITFKLLVIQAVIGQDIYQTLKLADHYQDIGLHEVAVKYYRRALFFGDDSLQSSTYPKIAESLLLAGKHSESIFFFGLAANTSKSDSLKAEYTFTRVLASVLNNNHNYALQYLYTINYHDSDYLTKKYHFYHGIISLNKNDFIASRHHFLLSAHDTIEKQHIDDLFREAKLHRPNPSTAKLLSIIFPGAGQAYSGDWRGAMNSFLLNAGLGTLALHTAINYSFLEGATSILPWLIRYYMGGFGHAEATAILKQREKQQLLLQNIFIKKNNSMLFE